MPASAPALQFRALRFRCSIGGAPAVLLLAAAVTLSACVTSGQQQAAADPQRPVVMAEQLIGLTPSGLAGTLGDPATTRKDRPAEIWQYRSEACILDVFLYDGATGAQVVHLEARNGTAAPVSPQLCLGSLTEGTPI